MGNKESNFKQTLSGIIALVSSLLVSIAGLFGAIDKVGDLQIFAIIMAALGLSWFGFLLYRYFKRRKYRHRMLHIGKELGDTGFNEALSYTTNDAHRFYGRQNDTFNIMNQILRDDYRLGVLHGESGVGKTSIIQAGLIPEFKKKNIQWGYISLNNLPGETETSQDLMDFLVKQVSRAFELPECRSLPDIAKKMEKKQDSDSVVFLDQFEQIFDRTAEDARLHFAQRLEQFCLSNHGLKIVIIVREDYFGRVHNMFQQLERKAISYLYKFNLTQAREVIRKSAGYDENLNETRPDDPLLAFEDDILDDLKDKDQRVHPVELSLICSTMMKVNGKLDPHGYLNGGKKQGWLNRYLDDVLKGQPQRESLQLLSSLIHMDKAATLTAKEVAQRSGLNVAETRRLLEDFQQSRLIVTDVTGVEKEEKRYCLAHEYLIASIRIRCGDVETPVQKYSRLLEARVNAWERENRNPHHLLRGKNLLKIRFQLRKHLGWDMDPLKKAFVRKSFSRFLTVMLSSFVIISVVLTGIFFTVHSLEERRLTELLSALKLKESKDLKFFEKELLRLSNKSIDFKKKILKEVLSVGKVDNEDFYKDEIMPVLYHTLIGISVENRNKVMDYALSLISPENASKLQWLFSRKNMPPADRPRYQQMLLNMLEKTKNSSYQKFVAYSLGEIGDDKAVEPLKTLLGRNNDSDVKIGIAEAMGKIKNKEAVDTLIELLKDPDNKVKITTAQVLGEIGKKSEKAVDSLVELLKSSNNDVKIKAADALGKIGVKSEKAVESLIKLIETSEDIFVKSRAVEALGRIGTTSEKSVESLIKLIETSEDNYVKSRGAEALGRIGTTSKKAVELLIKLLKDPNGDVKSDAAEALGEIGIKNEKAVIALIELIKNSDTSAHWDAGKALGKIKSKKAVELLIKLLKDPNGDVKSNAANALSEIGTKNERVVEALIELLKDPNGDVKSNAAHALGEIGIKNERVVETLIELLKDPSDDVKINAAYALESLDIKSVRVVEAFIELLKGPSDKAKIIATYMLGKIGNLAKDALPELNRLYKKEKDIKTSILFLYVMQSLAPSKKEYLAIIIEEILPRPSVVLSREGPLGNEVLKPLILRVVGEVAAKDEEGKKKVGKDLDFDGNMWTMLEWWKKYKEK